MNVVRLEAGSPQGPAEQLAQEKPGLYAVQPGETAIRAMERTLEFHRHPQPVVDYSGIDLPPGADKLLITEPEEMPAVQARMHEETARVLEWRLEQAQEVGLELPFAQPA